jgi:RNA polymerase sigma-70 factor (ECF subfamily)
MSMPGGDIEQRFEAALTPAIHRGAWGFCVRLCETREDAEDLLQDSLVIAFRKFGQLKDESRFKAWLFAIVRTRFISRRRRRSLPAGDSQWLEHVANAETKHPLSDVLAEALSRLPDQQRELLGLFYLDGLNLEETGEVLGLEPRAVAQRLHRARNTLRRRLSEFRELGVAPQG